MSFYDNHILPHVINCCCGLKAVKKQRQKVVPYATGRVLEVGMGTGLNMPYYNPDNVDVIYGLEPSEKSCEIARDPIEKAGLNVDIIGLDGQDIPLDNDSVDTVVLTYTLCTIPDPEKAMLEMRRVLSPSGKLLFSEHGLAPDAGVQKWQDRLDPFWGYVGGGCHLNRDIPELIRAGGFTLEALDEMYLPGPKFASYNYWGSAS